MGRLDMHTIRSMYAIHTTPTSSSPWPIDASTCSSRGLSTRGMPFNTVIVAGWPVAVKVVVVMVVVVVFVRVSKARVCVEVCL